MRISATLIDQYLRWKNEEYVPEQDLIDSIKGVWKPNRKMLCGISFEQIMQEPEKHKAGDEYVCEDIAWPAEAIEQECLPHFVTKGTWQCKEVRPYIVGTTTVNLVTKVDQLLANYIKELKTTQSPFDYEKYANAHQWRWYCLNFGAAFVQYKVFYWTEGVKGFKLHESHSFNLYPYTGMEAECLDTLGELVEYIKHRNLEQYVADDHPRLIGRTA